MCADRMLENWHYARCLADARSHFFHLKKTVKNQWAIEGLMKTYLEQPCFSNYRQAILDEILPKRCHWCSCDLEQDMPNNISPHSTWCVHYTRPKMPNTSLNAVGNNASK